MAITLKLIIVIIILFIYNLYFISKEKYENVFVLLFGILLFFPADVVGILSNYAYSSPGKLNISLCSYDIIIMLTRKRYFMIELLPALLCIFIMAYVIYLEFKEPKYNRDMFVDMSISIIIIIVGLYSMYEFKFDPKVSAFWAYIALLVMGFFYIGLVIYHEKHPKKQNVEQEEAILDNSEEDNK